MDIKETYKDAVGRTIQVVTASAPAHWASYLINGNDSALTIGEIMQADAFQDFYGNGSSPVDCEDIGFCHSCDASCQLAGDMADYKFLVRKDS